jgi:Reverse transcriptase (RNA-dependent DNA polymerase).
MEYASPVWSPHYECQKKLLESVQHRFLQFVAYKTNQQIYDHNYTDIEISHNIRNLEAYSIIPKTFEKLVHDKLSPLASKIINKNQYGFMKNRSTCSNLVSFSNFVTKEIQNGGQVDTLYTDFSKAYDVVNHNYLISKLQSIGISGSLLYWFHSFLTNRTQIVKVRKSKIYPHKGYIWLWPGRTHVRAHVPDIHQ